MEKIDFYLLEKDSSSELGGNSQRKDGLKWYHQGPVKQLLPIITIDLIDKDFIPLTLLIPLATNIRIDLSRNSSELKKLIQRITIVGKNEFRLIDLYLIIDLSFEIWGFQIARNLKLQKILNLGKVVNIIEKGLVANESSDTDIEIANLTEIENSDNLKNGFARDIDTQLTELFVKEKKESGIPTPIPSRSPSPPNTNDTKPYVNQDGLNSNEINYLNSEEDSNKDTSHDENSEMEDEHKKQSYVRKVITLPHNSLKRLNQMFANIKTRPKSRLESKIQTKLDKLPDALVEFSNLLPDPVFKVKPGVSGKSSVTFQNSLGQNNQPVATPLSLSNQRGDSSDNNVKKGVHSNIEMKFSSKPGLKLNITQLSTCLSFNTARIGELHIKNIEIGCGDGLESNMGVSFYPQILDSRPISSTLELTGSIVKGIIVGGVNGLLFNEFGKDSICFSASNFTVRDGNGVKVEWIAELFQDVEVEHVVEFGKLRRHNGDEGETVVFRLKDVVDKVMNLVLPKRFARKNGN